MDILKFINQNYQNTYKLRIGNYNFNIITSKKLDLSNYINIEKNENLEQVNLNIYLENSEELKNEFLNECKNMKKFIPNDINLFYSELSKTMNKTYTSENLYNKFYTNGLENYYCFEYVTDNFYVYFKKNDNKIIIIGDENNLERIIVDFLTVSNIFLPLHAIAVAKNSREGLGFLGESGSGKTSLMIKLMEKDYSFLTDDALFMNKDNNFIRVNNSFSFRKKYSNNIKLQQYCKNINKDKITINLNLAKHLIKFKFIGKIEGYEFYKLNNVKKIQELNEPFPCISKNSFWCLDFIVKKNKKEYINNLITNSVNEWNKIITNSQYIKIDFENFDKFTNEFIKKAQGVKKLKKILVSDYDDTFFTDEDSIIKNVNKVNEYRKDGNLFVIATSRSYNSIKKEFEKFNIKCDYVICNVGGVIIDPEENKIVYSNSLKMDDISKIEDVLKNENEIEVTKFYTNEENEEAKEILGYKIKGDENTLTKIKTALDNNNLGMNIILSNEGKMFINGNNTKESAIEELYKIINSDASITTVGDGTVDIGMIKKYNGYRMKNCSDGLKDITNKVVGNVYELLDNKNE